MKMFSKTLLGAAAAIVLYAGAASAVTVSPITPTSLTANDGAFGSAVAVDESYANTELFFTAAESLISKTTVTVNRYSEVAGAFDNISVSWSLAGSALVELVITKDGDLGVASLTGLAMSTGEKLSFFINGDADKKIPNTVTFIVSTEPPVDVNVPEVSAAGSAAALGSVFALMFLLMERRGAGTRRRREAV